MFNKNDAIKASQLLGINFNKYTLEEFLEGINIELEHGLINPKTNITNDNLIITSKIALAHLEEHPNYYNKDYGLRKFEVFLDYKLNNE